MRYRIRPRLEANASTDGARNISLPVDLHVHFEIVGIATSFTTFVASELPRNAVNAARVAFTLAPLVVREVVVTAAKAAFRTLTAHAFEELHVVSSEWGRGFGAPLWRLSRM